jgi:hypothetical protein
MRMFCSPPLETVIPTYSSRVLHIQVDHWEPNRTTLSLIRPLKYQDWWTIMNAPVSLGVSGTCKLFVGVCSVEGPGRSVSVHAARTLRSRVGPTARVLNSCPGMS